MTMDFSLIKMKVTDLKNIEVDLVLHPLLLQIALLRMALLNEDQAKLVGMSFAEEAGDDDLLRETSI